MLDEKNRCKRCGKVHGITYTIRTDGRRMRRVLQDFHSADCKVPRADLDAGFDAVMRI